jgi:hypothetical protein
MNVSPGQYTIGFEFKMIVALRYTSRIKTGSRATYYRPKVVLRGLFLVARAY